MNYQALVKVSILSLGLAVFSSCKSSQNQNETLDQEPPQREQMQRGQGQRGGERPTPEQIIVQMDANQDGKLSKDEVKGPLAEDFTKIDTNDDGFITKEEIESAPKPKRRGGGKRG